MAPQRVPDVVQREIAGETFLVPVRGHLADLQELFVLNEVGSWVWARLDGMTSLEDLTTSLAAEYEVDTSQARRDLGTFLKELQAAELVQFESDEE